jgi:hypothetical protein
MMHKKVRCTFLSPTVQNAQPTKICKRPRELVEGIGVLSCLLPQLS